jgi:hypothetical protein
VGPNMVNSFTLGFTRYRNQNSTLNAFKQDFVATSGIANIGLSILVPGNSHHHGPGI